MSCTQCSPVKQLTACCDSTVNSGMLSTSSCPTRVTPLGASFLVRALSNPERCVFQGVCNTCMVWYQSHSIVASLRAGCDGAVSCGGRWDMQALSMAHCIGRPEQAVPVFRLVTKATMEERVHQLVDKKKGSELVFKSSVRWGYLLSLQRLLCSGPCSIAASALS